MIIKNKYYSQIEIFKLWLEENRDNFICKPIIFEDTESYLSFRYENIIDNIVVRVDNNSSISIRVENLLDIDCLGLLSDFLVVLMTDKNGKYYNESLLEKDRIHYDIPEPIYYDEYNLFMKWSNKTISEDKFLYVSKDNDNNSFAKIITSEEINNENNDNLVSKVISLVNK
jgi:hypothetical protein